MKHIISILLICTILTGCAKNTPETGISTETIQQTEAPVLHYTLYIPNNNADGWITEDITVSEITPEDILSQLQRRGIIDTDAIIQEFHIENNVLNMDFNDVFAQQLCSTGTAGEMMIVGSIVNTFLNAYQAEKIYFTVNGGVLESGHVIYDFPLTYME